MNAALLLIALPLQAQAPTLSINDAVSAALARHPRIQVAQATLKLAMGE